MSRSGKGKMHSKRTPKLEEDVEKSEDERDPGCMEIFVTILSYIIAIITFPVSVFICFRVISEFERAIVFRIGRIKKGKARGPGLIFVLPCIDDYIKIDLRTITYHVPTQEILTKDSVTIQVDAVVYYKVYNPRYAVINIANFRHSTMTLAQATLRNVAGKKLLAEILEDKEALSAAIQKILDLATDPWGVKVERIEIKDVRLPKPLQRAMASEAEANREAKAKLVAAEGEKNAAQALKQASDIISSSPAALQLRYLQTLSTISTEQNSTIIFPIPIELLGMFNNHTQSQSSGLGCTCYEGG